MFEESGGEFNAQRELLPLDSDEEIALEIQKVLDKHAGDEKEAVKALVAFVQACIEEALILRTPAVPLQRLGKTALISDLQHLEGTEIRPDD